MKSELMDIVTDIHWTQEHVRELSGLTRIDRQYESFQNANNSSAVFRSHGASPASPYADERWSRLEAVGHVGGNLFGSQLSPTEEGTTRSRGRVLHFADFTTTPTPLKHKSWLDEALEELAGCPDDAVEEGVEGPSEVGLIKARELIVDLVIHIEPQPDIYPMDQGSIAIDIRHPNGKLGVLFLIERDGSGVLFSRSQRAKGRIRVDDASDLLREGGLSEMRRMGISS